MFNCLETILCRKSLSSCCFGITSHADPLNVSLKLNKLLIELSAFISYFNGDIFMHSSPCMQIFICRPTNVQYCSNKVRCVNIDSCALVGSISMPMKPSIRNRHPLNILDWSSKSTTRFVEFQFIQRSVRYWQNFMRIEHESHFVSCNQLSTLALPPFSSLIYTKFRLRALVYIDGGN